MPYSLKRPLTVNNFDDFVKRAMYLQRAVHGAIARSQSLKPEDPRLTLGDSFVVIILLRALGYDFK